MPVFPPAKPERRERSPLMGAWGVSPVIGRPGDAAHAGLMYDPCGLHISRHLVHILAILVAMPVLAGCGVAFRETFDGTELFRGLSVAGERRPGAELIVNLEVAQDYPVPVQLACYYEDFDRLTDDQKKLAFEERATRVGETVLDPAPDRRPEKNPKPTQVLSFRFSVPEPGDYFLACLTPADVDNGWGVKLHIE
jgi:hypothetical protein